MMTRRTVGRGVLLGAGIAATVVLAAACGGGQSNASGGAGVSTSSAAGATGSNLGSGTTFIPASTTVAPPPTAPVTTTPGRTTGGGSAGSGGAPAVSKPTSTPECRVANLTLSLGPSDGAAGHFYQALRFTNKGGSSCAIVGFPGVSYVTGDKGTQVGAPAQRDGAKGGQITLKPGATASSVLTLTDVGVFDSSACKPTTIRGLRVYPPDERSSMFVARSGTGCAGSPPSPQLRVQTVKPGLGSA